MGSDIAGAGGVGDSGPMRRWGSHSGTKELCGRPRIKPRSTSPGGHLGENKG